MSTPSGLRPSRSLAALLPLAVASAVVSGCGDSGSPGASPAPSGSGAASITVVTSFYPLQYVTERILGDQGKVQSLTKPGAEPHDLELTPQDVASVGTAELVVYSKGFQPAVDTAVAQQGGDRTLDVGQAAKLDLTYTPLEHGEEEHGEEHADESGVDPHFWLDPTRLAAVGDAVAARLAKARPAQAAVFTANAGALKRDLDTLDGEFRTGLASCASKDIVTSHNAFGYLARRYGLNQVGIAGLSPEQEPSAKDLAAATEFVRSRKVRTIYYETLVSPAVAQTVAQETGAKTAVLDPLEGLSDASEGKDYLEVMRANLASLRAGQPCT